MIAKRLEAARLGELDPDAEEPDPEQFFRAQWLNQWPRRRAETPKNTEDLLPRACGRSSSKRGCGRMRR